MRWAITVWIKGRIGLTTNRFKTVFEYFDLLLQEINLSGLLNDHGIQLLQRIFLKQNATLKVFDQILR